MDAGRRERPKTDYIVIPIGAHNLLRELGNNTLNIKASVANRSDTIQTVWMVSPFQA